MKTLFFTILLSFLLLVACTQTINEQPPKQLITTFEQCIQSGNPVMESYPRQCNTPDGKHFVEAVIGETINPSKTTCQIDDDCQLINQELGYGCCWAGACKAIDYSQDQWIAVNAQAFQEDQKLNCPPPEKCGPAVMCNPQPINDQFEARCENGICVKRPTSRSPPEKICKDLCGDGLCQENVCFARGCPCAENAQSCPQDCAKDCLYGSQPVCGLVHVQCIRAPCPPLYETFNNRCELEKNSLAEFVHAGTCKEDPNPPICGNNLCEEGEANDPGGCGPGADPRCLGPPAREGTCPQDCTKGSTTCGNGLCEEGEASLCPACTYTPPYCRIACRAGTCPEDCA